MAILPPTAPGAQSPTPHHHPNHYALDLFAGPGGWDEGLNMLGVRGVIGAEMDPDAVATAEAAGHRRLKADVRTLATEDFRGITGLIASPPCQTFSDAGKSEGQAGLDDLADALDLVLAGDDCITAATTCGLDAGDPRSTLVLEPMRFIRDLRPRWIAFEEVTQVLPVWERYAALLRALGYSTWAGILNAADYGVPQKRRRAFMLASLDIPAHPPTPTHSEEPDEGLFDDRLPWVTMAEALEWDADDCRAANLLAPEPAHDPERCLWPLWRPATTVVRSFRPDVIAAPGYRLPGAGPRQNSPGSLGVTPAQMLRLQTVRPDFPIVAKGMTKRQSLIGAFLPPTWAAEILRPLVRGSLGACLNCGNDDPAEGYAACWDCIPEVAA